MVVIGGPTASGKTDMSIRIAEYYNCPILSADSRQIYRELTIGTARPSETELARAPHYFIGNKSIKDSFSAGQYEREALSLLKQLFIKNKIVLIVGGTGLYLKAIMEGLDEFPDIDQDIRNSYHQLYAEEGIEPLKKVLAELDPEYYREVDTNNPQRLIRALSVIKSSGEKFSNFRKNKTAQRDFTSIQIALSRPREELYNSINLRVDKMMESGLLKEVRQLLPYQQLPALNTVGYKELFAHLNHQYSLEDALNKIKQHTRNYAKRQITWFKNQADFKWFDADDFEGIIDHIHMQIKTESKK